MRPESLRQKIALHIHSPSHSTFPFNWQRTTDNCHLPNIATNFIVVPIMYTTTLNMERPVPKSRPANTLRHTFHIPSPPLPS